MRMVTDARKVTGRLSLTLALAFLAAGCMDLEVENLLAPDRERATRNPADVEAFIGGAFHPPFFNAIHRRTQAVYLWPVAASEFTASFVGGGTLLWYDEIKEPRIPHDNGASLSIGNGPWGPRFFWADVTQANTVAYDGLQLLNQGLVIRQGTVDVTPRARAFAKFMQGWTWGYLSLVFDRAHVVPETVDIPVDNAGMMQVTLNTLVPHDSVLKAALGALDEAIQIARQNPGVVRYPSFSESPFWFGSPEPISNDLFIRAANTLAARLLVLSARTPEDRRNVDWNRVLAYTANGLENEDFERTLSTGNRTSQLVLDAQRNTATSTTNLRWDYRAIGAADQSGAYQRWLETPLSQRDRFDIVTPDRRITGTTPRSDGSYTRYRSDNNGFDPDRGRYLFSAYQWSRHAIRHGLTGTTTGNDRATYPLITADENRLLRAEALLRTGNAQAAADLINVTRTRTQRIGSVTHPGLPPVTTAGAPNVEGVCVPRRDDGSCGNLLDALRYERTIELAAMDVFRGYAESRGWGTLVDGSLLQWPVPGDALELYGLPNYTYGGVGGEATAKYAPASTP
jgi:hypothetical protein